MIKKIKLSLFLFVIGSFFFACKLETEEVGLLTDRVQCDIQSADSFYDDIGSDIDSTTTDAFSQEAYDKFLSYLIKNKRTVVARRSNDFIVNNGKILKANSSLRLDGVYESVFSSARGNIWSNFKVTRDDASGEFSIEREGVFYDGVKTSAFKSMLLDQLKKRGNSFFDETFTEEEIKYYLTQFELAYKGYGGENSDFYKKGTQVIYVVSNNSSYENRYSLSDIKDGEELEYVVLLMLFSNSHFLTTTDDESLGANIGSDKTLDEGDSDDVKLLINQLVINSSGNYVSSLVVYSNDSLIVCLNGNTKYR